MKKLLIILVILCVVFAGGFYFFKKYNSEKRIHSEELFWRGRKALETNDDVNAFKLLSDARKQSPDNAEFNLWAGIAAKKLGKKEQAYSFFENSWAKGKKEPVVFLNMIATSSLPKKEKILAFEEMATEIADEKSRLELTALLKFQRGNTEEAAQLMEKLVSIHPEGIYGEFYAQILLRLKEPEKAVIMLERIRKEGKMNASCYIILSELYFAIDEMQKATELYTEAETRGMNTPEVTQHYGQNLFFYGNNFESRKVLTNIQLARMFSVNDISSAEIFLKELQKGSTLSEKFIAGTAESFQKLIKKQPDSFDRFTRKRFLEQACTELNKFCSRAEQNQKTPTDSAQRDLTAAQQDFLHTAQTLVQEFPDSLKLPDYNYTTHQARIILMMLDSATEDSPGIENLLKLADGSSRWLEGERYFGKYLLATLSAKPDLVKQAEYFDIATELLSNNMAIQLSLADNLANQGKFQDSLVLFDRLTTTSIILARSPIVQFMRSRILINSGEQLKGERILISLLRRGYITRQLLTELGQVALNLQDEQATDMVLQTVKSHTAKHPEMYLLTASIYSQKGEPAKAEEELSRLLTATDNPELKAQALLEKARLQSRNGDNEKALNTLTAIKQTSPEIEILKARILNALGKNTEAMAIFSQLKEIPTTARSLYAAILAGTGYLNKAEVQLEEILTEDPGNPEALLNLALLFNAKGENNKALNAAQQVVDRNPDNIRANTLLAQLLLTTGNPRDAANLAIKVLSLSPANPVALRLLPGAYLTSGEYIKAINAANKGLQILSNDDFILLQKATALIELAKTLNSLTPDSGDKQTTNTEKSAEEMLEEEVTALTSDIVFTGAISTLNSSTELKENTTVSDFLAGRDRNDLLQEATTILNSISTQETATVLLLEAELLQNRTEEVIKALKNKKLKVNELFSLGVIADSLKLWPVSATAYREAFNLQPTNPVVLNNYANAIILAAEPVDAETRQLLLTAARDLPQLFAGDSKAVNTAAMVFNHFKEWSDTLNLARSYPLLFKQDSELNQLLKQAREEQRLQPAIQKENHPEPPELPKGPKAANSGKEQNATGNTTAATDSP